MSVKPPLKSMNKINNEVKTHKRRKDDHILKLHKKKNYNKSNNQNTALI